MSDPDRNFFEEEGHLQAWATEMNDDYTPGTQGEFGQPVREMSDDRLKALDGLLVSEIRSDSNLPAIPDTSELKLHRAEVEIARMTVQEHIQWLLEAAEWLSDNPDATIDMLIDPDYSV